jgi:hypothetical protein
MKAGSCAGTVREKDIEWPNRPPKELAIRLADALQYSNCGPEDLWDEIGDWLRLNQVAPPDLRSEDLIAPPDPTTAHRKFQNLSKSGNAMNLTRLVYASHHSGLDAPTFDNILRNSRENNARDLITGALIISEDGFMQLLEGSRSAVGQCFVRIMKDNRHDDIQVLSCGDVQSRLFQEWTMHLIKASRIKQDILTRYLVNGAFKPSLMSGFAIEDLCRTLSEGNWEAVAA